MGASQATRCRLTRLLCGCRDQAQVLELGQVLNPLLSLSSSTLRFQFSFLFIHRQTYFNFLAQASLFSMLSLCKFTNSKWLCFLNKEIRRKMSREKNTNVFGCHQCSFQSQSKKLLSAADGDHPRDPQLVQRQRLSDWEPSNPNWYILIFIVFHRYDLKEIISAFSKNKK